MKQTWAQLHAENVKLKWQLNELKQAMRIADRHPVRYEAVSWIAIPLHARQIGPVLDRLADRKCYDDYKTDAAGNRLYEEMCESDILPEYRFYLLHYMTDAEGNDLGEDKVWGLEPI